LCSPASRQSLRLANSLGEGQYWATSTERRGRKARPSLQQGARTKARRPTEPKPKPKPQKAVPPPAVPMPRRRRRTATQRGMDHTLAAAAESLKDTPFQCLCTQTSKSIRTGAIDLLATEFETDVRRASPPCRRVVALVLHRSRSTVAAALLRVPHCRPRSAPFARPFRSLAELPATHVGDDGRRHVSTRATATPPRACEQRRRPLRSVQAHVA
jgi:hypothetical protein